MRIKDRPEYRSKPVPFSLSANDLVQTAVKTMSEKNIGSVVIVDDDMQVKGIVTERDLMRRLLNKSLEPMMSAFHPKATEQRTQFYVGLMPTTDSFTEANRILIR